jgi:AraC-like DNA-binding protein/mannose-6-phosphate isomerase-like protein (cupin superfamily)
MPNTRNIPVYSLDKFRSPDERSRLFQVEVFDANRHFQVSYPHRHDFYEVLFLTNGSGIHIIDNDEYYIHPPSVFFLSPGQAHKLELSHDIEGFIFLFTSEFYLLHQSNKNRLLEYPFFFSVEQKNPPLLLKNKDNINFLRTLFTRGCEEMRQRTHRSEEIAHAILDLILLTCDKLYPDRHRTLNSGKGHELAKKFLYLIEENYQKNLRVNDYADMLAITPNHLTQIVKQVTGKTSIELLQDKLIVEVKRLLLHTNMTVSEIAELMNFPDQSYFTKYFKKITGATPLQYRKTSNKIP